MVADFGYGVIVMAFLVAADSVGRGHLRRENKIHGLDRV